MPRPLHDLNPLSGSRITSYHDLAKELNAIEADVVNQTNQQLQQAYDATVERLRNATGVWDIQQATQILAELERQQQQQSIIITDLFQEEMERAFEDAEETAQLMAKRYGLELTSKPLISRQFLDVAVGTMPTLIKGLNDEFLNDVARIFRQSVLAQQTPLDVMRELGKLPPFQHFDPASGRWLPMTEEELRASIDAKGPFAKLFRRIESIARTELGRISQTANYLTLAELGKQDSRWQKEWSAVMDHRTRPDHAIANGQRVAWNADFEVGGSLMAFPMDPRGPASEVINCRCVMLPYHPAFDDPTLARGEPSWHGLPTGTLTQAPA